jgi:hypothetical protein
MLLVLGASMLPGLAPVAIPGVADGWQAIAPQVAAIEPAGGQRGTDVTVAVRGDRLAGTLGCLVEQPGIEVLAVSAKAKDRAELRLRLLPDCPLGSHTLRLHTAHGCSNLFLFSVSALRSVLERRTGDDVQDVPLGCTVEAVLRGDETDRYRVVAAAGTAICCEVEGLRLGQQALDLELALTDPDGNELARADDAAPTGKDPWGACAVPAAGSVLIAVRAAVPGEGPRGVYRLHVGTFARPVGALPCGGQPGEELDVALLDARGDRRARVRLPDDGRELFAWVPEPDGGPPPTPIWLRVGGPPNRLPVADEQQRQWLELPCAVHGVVADPNAPPRFHFKGRKDAEIEFRALARVLRSPLDPTLVVRGADGRFLAYNDDGDTQDSTLRWKPPADGDYVVEVRDLLRGGSPLHFFRLEAGPRLAPARMSIAVQRQVEPVVTVPQGGHGAAILQLTGIDQAAAPVTGPLPAGVAVAVGPRLAGTNQVPLLFTATAEAPLAGALLPVGTRTGDATADLRAFATPQPLLLGRNNTPLLTAVSRRLPLAVTEAAPWQVTIAPPRVPLIRGSSITLPVNVQRKEGYQARLRVRPVFAPPGLGVGQTIVDTGKNDGTLQIEARGDAPVGEFPCLLTSIARVDGAVFEHALPFLFVRVEEPWIRAEAGKARTTQGRATELRLALAAARAPAAAFAATLTGLPRGVTTVEQQVAADATAVVFPLQVATDAAVGRHRGLQVELRLPGEGGQPVLHRFVAGELRIDAPRADIGAAPGTAAGGDP